MESVFKFLGHHPIGLMMRTFAADSDGVERRAEMVMKMINIALDLRVEDRSIFSRVDILIPCDDRYPADCGQTAATIRDRAQSSNLISDKVFVTEIHQGDLFCGVLNYGITKQLAGGMHYSTIVSPEVHSYMNFETMLAVLQKAAEGSWATGVAIDELTESILAGRLANTFCMWHNQRLGQVGNFDLMAAKPVDEASANYKRGWDKEKGFVYYQMAGVEEIIPLCRMIQTNKEQPCIAAVLPQGKGVKLYQPPPPGPELDRHLAKMATKTVRQAYLAAQVGFDLDYLQGGLMN